MPQVGAVEGDDERRPPAERACSPSAQAVVRVDQVEATAAVRASELARGAHVVAGTAGLVREQLQLEAVELPQRLDLVADEPAEAGVRRRRVRARHDQHPHGGRERTRERNCHRAVVELSHPGLEP